MFVCLFVSLSVGLVACVLVVCIVWLYVCVSMSVFKWLKDLFDYARSTCAFQ